MLKLKKKKKQRREYTCYKLQIIIKKSCDQFSLYPIAGKILRRS